MRRLRETVYEIVEGVKQMPGGGGSSTESGRLTFRLAYFHVLWLDWMV